MRSATAGWRRFPVRFLRLVLNSTVLVVFYVLTASAQQPPQAGAPASDISNIPKTVGDTVDRVNTRNAPNDADVGKKPTDTDESCLLPPLSLITRTTVAAEQLQIKPKAKKEYHQACVALRNKNIADAEQHLRKAVQDDARYASAWVTLGQTLVTRQLHDEARNACQQGSTADPTYVPAYLCLADIAARTHTWDEVLKLSARALTFDPSHDAVAYEYQAAANLNLRDLAAAEKSALRALEIDKDHHEPRVHFVLAQIYEAKGDRNNEALQLREYLKYASDAVDVAAIKELLSKLDEQLGKSELAVAPAENSSTSAPGTSRRSWAPADIDEAVPPVRSGATCPLPQILKETSKHTHRTSLRICSASVPANALSRSTSTKTGRAATPAPR